MLRASLGPWERTLRRERLVRCLARGALAALVVASGALAIGWLLPTPETELRPWAALLASVPLAIALGVGAWPSTRVAQAAELDTRLALGDRLATAWIFRDSDQPLLRLQRADAIASLERVDSRRVPRWRPARLEAWALGAAALLVLLLLVAPSPQQAVLDQQAADQASVAQAAQQLDALREQAAAAPGLTPDQARQLDQLLQQSEAELQQARTAQQAAAVVGRAQGQVAQQLGDPNAELRDEALAAMSETLAAEPLSRALGQALQSEDAQAAHDALRALSAQADSLSAVERQALSRALERAANVGRGDPRSANALRQASQALAAGDSPQSSLSEADAALRDAIQASDAQAAINATQDRLHDLQARLSSGAPLTDDASTESPGSGRQPLAPTGVPPAALPTPVGSAEGAGAGVAPGSAADQAPAAPGPPAAETIFVPGRVGSGPTDQDLVEQPFTIGGSPRPYREVLGQYAQSTRDYVDRPDLSPAVRDLVKQYFQQLEDGQ